MFARLSNDDKNQREAGRGTKLKMNTIKDNLHFIQNFYYNF